MLRKIYKYIVLGIEMNIEKKSTYLDLVWEKLGLQDLSETEVLNIPKLDSNEIGKLTELFISKLADADHNFFEDMGHYGESNTDRDSIIIELARSWKDFPSTVQKLTGGQFWNEMKRLAMLSYESGNLSI